LFSAKLLKRDLIQHFVYWGEHAGIAVAERFVTAVHRAYVELSKMPELGAPGKIQKGRFTGVRIWPVTR